ncbi:unnamed protein product, partial [Sphagnum jensenii]
TKQHIRNFFGGLGTILCGDCQFVFWEFLTPFILGGCNFFISNPFSMIVSVLDVPREGVQILLGHQKQQSPPFEACPKCLSNQGKLIAKGERNGRMFTLDVNMHEVNSMLFTHGKGAGDIGIWHKRVGH